MRRWVALILAVAIATAVFAAQSSSRATYRIVKVASGFEDAVDLDAPRNEPGKLYVVEQDGVVRVVVNGRVRPEPFLDIDSLVDSGGEEQGLLGLAFHPQYAKNHKFYVQYTDNDENTRLIEYRSNGQRAIPSSARQLFFQEDPYANHNGGNLLFGPDGRLYFSTGDGGAGGDPEERAQNPKSLFGKLLSMNVATKGLKIEAIGLRNPWRFSFDRANRDLYIGDVGQNDWEEIDWVSRRSPGLENYGWDHYEGLASFERTPLGPGRLIRPVVVYDHDAGISVTGGYVYRGSGVPAARGRYFYGDYGSGTIWSFVIRGGKATSQRREPFTVEGLTSFGEDARGELYLVAHGGTIYRLAR